MNPSSLIRCLGCCLCLLGTAAFAGPSTNSAGGALAAQGDTLKAQGKTTAALAAYRQAAQAGSVNGAFAAGEILFASGRLGGGREQVLELAEGLGHLYFAATNRHPQACVLLSEALAAGLGVRTNFAAAYAWLQVAATLDPSLGTDLDRLGVRLEPNDILRGQKIARDYLAGRWPSRVARPIDLGDERLQVQGVSGSGQDRLVVVNGQSFTVGEFASVTPVSGSKISPNERLVVTCQAVGPDYILLAINGDPRLKLLPYENR